MFCPNLWGSRQPVSESVDERPLYSRSSPLEKTISAVGSASHEVDFGQGRSIGQHFEIRRGCNYVEATAIGLKEWLKRKFVLNHSPLAQVIAQGQASPLSVNTTEPAGISRRMYSTDSSMLLISRRNVAYSKHKAIHFQSAVQILHIVSIPLAASIALTVAYFAISRGAPGNDIYDLIGVASSLAIVLVVQLESPRLFTPVAALCDGESLLRGRGHHLQPPGGSADAVRHELVLSPQTIQIWPPDASLLIPHGGGHRRVRGAGRGLRS